MRAVGRVGAGDWVAVARLLPTQRDPRTVRQRYVDTLRAPNAVLRPWRPQEDEALALAVRAVGSGAWTAVAAHLPGRSAKQCAQRWHNHVRTTPSRDAWTPAEDERLRALHVSPVREHLGKVRSP
jgi:hypothetical protein